MNHGVWRLVAVALVLALTTTACDAGPEPKPAPTADASAAAAERAREEVKQHVDRARAEIDVALAKQSAALLAGDRGAFTATAGIAPVRQQLVRRFAALRALKVVEFSQRVGGLPTQATADLYTASISTTYCLVVRGCGNDEIIIQTTWQSGPGGFRLISLEDSNEGPRPWETDNLVAVFGTRVVVATSPAYARAARTLLPVAERAARSADAFRLDRDAPYRYVVYLAGPEQFERWYDQGGSQSDTYALDRTVERTDVVARFDAEEVGDEIRHSMTHLAVLGHKELFDLDNDGWWLREGLADLTSTDRSSFGEQTRASVRRFLKAGYRGELGTLTPFTGDTDDQLDAKWALARYATACVDEKYGRKKLMALADALLRKDAKARRVGQDLLGAPWAKVEADCLAYSRKVVGSS